MHYGRELAGEPNDMSFVHRCSQVGGTRVFQAWVSGMSHRAVRSTMCESVPAELWLARSATAGENTTFNCDISRLGGHTTLQSLYDEHDKQFATHISVLKRTKCLVLAKVLGMLLFIYII
jgi:hypothetical protein